MLKGLRASIYRFPLADCTLNGITGADKGYRDVTVVGFVYDDQFFVPLPESSRIFNAEDDAPAVVIRKRGGYLSAVPADPETGQPKPGWWMNGGNFIYTSDSRFTAINPYPIPVHDRQE
jgi:hypothetical protein